MKGRTLQLFLQTLSLVAGFMVWVIVASLVPYIKEDIPLTSGQIAWITAIPVILGSLLRIPIGYFTSRYGSRKLFFIGFILLIPPVYFISLAHSHTDLILGGLFLGAAGAMFSIGVTSLPKYYPKERHGFVNGIYGIGNLGTALTSFLAPILAKKLGWVTTVQCYLLLLFIFAILIFFLGDRKEKTGTIALTEQIQSVYRDKKLWFLCLFYFITFGSFVTFTIYLPNFLVVHFHLDKVDAGFRTAAFIAVSTLIRPFGGWLADKFNPFKILMLVFFGLMASGIILAFMPSLSWYTAGCLAIAFCGGIGNGTVFKLVPMYFSQQAGIVNGLVSAMGGLGGFFPPLLLTFLFHVTGHYAIGFMALSQVAMASLIIAMGMYYQDKLAVAEEIVENTVEGIMVTNLEGKIKYVNKAFTKVTGYSPSEVYGATPRILKSGYQDGQYYKDMWELINKQGFWQGEIWNKRKNGEIYLEWLTISAIKNEAGDVTSYAAMFSEL